MVTEDSGPENEFLVPAAFADVIGYHLRIAQEASFAAIKQGGGKKDLKPGWYTILTLLSDNPGLTPGQLSRLCGRDRSTLTGVLKDLASRGLIARRRNRNDQRSYSVRLTDAGRETLERLRAFSREHDARLDEIVGADKDLFLRILRRIAAAFGNPADPETERSPRTRIKRSLVSKPRSRGPAAAPARRRT
jgi:DNA-binding MarR family transcriptional regulator